MKRIVIGAALIVVSLAAASAQTPAKTGKGAAGLGKTEAGSSADRNIRAYIELLRSDLRSDKAQVLGEVMQLDADQATKFWPIYKEFESDYQKLGDRIAAAVLKYAEEFDKLSDATADQLATEALTIEQQRNTLKSKYYDRFKQALGAITAMRFLQVENQLERITDLQVAASLPIADQR